MPTIKNLVPRSLGSQFFLERGGRQQTVRTEFFTAGYPNVQESKK